MREHLRIDTFKVFEQEDKIITAIMKEKGCNKSDAYREALKVWSLVYSTINENELIKNRLQAIEDNQAEMNHKLNLLLSKNK